MSSLAEHLARLFMRQEGFTDKDGNIKPETVAARHNNPGNIMDLEHYRKTGEYRPQRYDSVEQGFAALVAWMDRRISEGKTLREAVERFAPKGHGDNNPAIYARNVATWAGIDPDTPLRQIDARPGPPQALAELPQQAQAFSTQAARAIETVTAPARAVANVINQTQGPERDLLLLAVTAAGALALFDIVTRR